MNLLIPIMVAPYDTSANLFLILKSLSIYFVCPCNWFMIDTCHTFSDSILPAFYQTLALSAITYFHSFECYEVLALCVLII